jgi:hypothetical protein
MHHRQSQAGIDAPAVNDHRAGAALPVVAALLRAGKLQPLAQRVEQGRARVELELAGLAVHGEGHLQTGQTRHTAGWRLGASN